MTFTYTSTDLADIAESIPARAHDAGIFFVPGVKAEGESHIALSGSDLNVDEAVRVAAKVGAVFISSSASTFEVQNYLDELADDQENLSVRAKKLIEAARQYNGQHQSVTVVWAAQGLLYEWHAGADWLVPFLDELHEAVEESGEESNEAQRERLTEYYTNIQTAAAVLAESRKYRGEQVGKRRHLMATIIAEAGMDEIDDITLSHRVMPEANRIINAKVYEFEQDFRARKEEITDELRNFPAWQVVYSKAERKAAAMKFLTKKADGYRLSTDLAVEISEAAANPVYVSRY
ncbi:hypothetical protein [Arthrobacter sp. M2012083]|uniref:hypothetical protein n=1 Tax=Arthrobacter sp. M2012083 TaxID=1197706 RepID=UPI00031B9D86|nr:hypothetical protein [Arthrobacter sp. M2012083]